MNAEMFDNLAHDVAERFGLSADKARQLMGVLIALIFDSKRGGFAGFASLFYQKGLGNLVQSWIGTGRNESISPAQVENVFGSPLLGAIAGKLGVDRLLTASAISGLLPGLVNELTVGGKAPASIPETLKSWVVSVGHWLGDLGNFGWGALTTGAAAVGGAVAGGARAMGNAADATVHAVDKSGSGLGKLLMWLLAAALLVGAFLFFKGCKKDAATPPADTAGMPMETASVAQANPRFGFENVDGKATISGQVASDAEKSKLMDAIAAAFGTGNVNGDITVMPILRRQDGWTSWSPCCPT